MGFDDGLVFGKVVERGQLDRRCVPDPGGVGIEPFDAVNRGDSDGHGCTPVRPEKSDCADG